MPRALSMTGGILLTFLATWSGVARAESGPEKTNFKGSESWHVVLPAANPTNYKGSEHYQDAVVGHVEDGEWELFQPEAWD